MRWILAFVIGLASLHVCPAGETPREFVRRFYAAYKTWEIVCVPENRQEHLISPYCGMEMIRIFRRVNLQRNAWKLKFPDDAARPVKPPWVQEDVFTNRYEGATHVAIGKMTKSRGRKVVQANLELVDNGVTHSWTDKVILDRPGPSWVIADIEYAGGGTLLSSTERELKEGGKALMKKP